MGPNGEMLIYILNYNTATETGSLALWNSTALIQNIYNAGADLAIYTEPTSFNGTGWTYQWGLHLSIHLERDDKR